MGSFQDSRQRLDHRDTGSKMHLWPPQTLQDPDEDPLPRVSEMAEGEGPSKEDEGDPIMGERTHKGRERPIRAE